MLHLNVLLPSKPTFTRSYKLKLLRQLKSNSGIQFFVVDVLSQINPDLLFYFPTKLKTTQPKWLLSFSFLNLFSLPCFCFSLHVELQTSTFSLRVWEEDGIWFVFLSLFIFLHKMELGSNGPLISPPYASPLNFWQILF